MKQNIIVQENSHASETRKKNLFFFFCFLFPHIFEINFTIIKTIFNFEFPETKYFDGFKSLPLVCKIFNIFYKFLKH